MEGGLHKYRFLWKSIRRGMIVLFFGYIILTTMVVFAIQLPAVQVRLINYIAQTLHSATGYSITIGKISINWMHHIIINGVAVKDKQGSDMIVVEEADLEYSLLGLLGKDIVLKQVNIINPTVHLLYDDCVNDVNIADFVYSLQNMSESHDTLPRTTRYPHFTVQKINLENGRFSYNDPQAEPETDRFDFTHFVLDSIHLQVSYLDIYADTVSLRLHQLFLKNHQTGLTVSRAKGHFTICENFLSFTDFDVMIGNSRLAQNLEFRYNGFRNLTYLQDSVWYQLMLTDAQIDSRDLTHFIPELKNFNEVWQVSGAVIGYFNDLTARLKRLEFGNESYFSGKVRLKGLPNVENLFTDADIEDAYLQKNDVLKYGLTAYKEYLQPILHSRINAKFKGYYNNFSLSGWFDTNVGIINPDIEIVFDARKPIESLKYKGVLNVKDFRLAMLTNHSKVDYLTAGVRMDGWGADLQTLKLKCSGIVSKVVILKYPYQNIYVNLRFGNGMGQATLDVKDSALVMDMLAQIDINPLTPTWQIDADIKKFDLYTAKLFDLPLKVKTSAKIYATGLKPNEFSCHLSASKTVFSNPAKHFEVGHLDVNYNYVPNGRHLNVQSELIQADIKGKFGITSLVAFTNALQYRIAAALDSNTHTALWKKALPDSLIKADVTVQIGNINPLLELTLPHLRMAKGTLYKSNMVFDTSRFLIKSTFISDSLTWKNTQWYGNKCILQLSAWVADSTIKSYVEATSAKQTFNGQFATEKMSFDASIDNQALAFNTAVQQTQMNNYLNISGQLSIGNSTKILTVTRAKINLLERIWSVNPNNSVVFKPNEITFNHLELNADSQSIAALGKISTNDPTPFTIWIKNFNIGNFSEFINTPLSGLLNAKVNITDFYNNPNITGRLDAHNLTVKKLFIGDVIGKSDWDAAGQKLNLNLEIDRLGNKMFNLFGHYMPNPASGADRLNLVAIMNKTNMVVFEPFIQDILSDLKGEATGLITLRGNLYQPIVSGQIDIEDGSFKVNYTNATYYFQERINLKPNGFTLNNIALYDSQGGIAIVDGGFYHSNFKNFDFSFKGEFKNAQLMNTNAKLNELFYGSAIGTGSFTLKGDLNNLDIGLKAKVVKGSRMHVVYQAGTDTDKQSFINFVNTSQTLTINPSDSRDTANVAPNDNFRVKTHMELELTNDAYAEFILDKLSGDKIAGHGEGDIKLTYDSEGDFNMYGKYTFSRESYYVFSFLNIVNKKFTIKPGSTVAWMGDPTNGQLNVQAAYEDRVSLHPLVDTAYAQRPGIRTPYPVSTILYLKGDLLKPDISYDIKIYNYPTVIADVPLFNYVSAFENRIHSNVNEMNTQVFGLLVFRQFFNSTTSIQDAAGGTVSELLSNQLSKLVSEIDQNLQVDFRLNGLDASALNSLQMRISYELLDGKVRITRSGTFTNTQSQATTSSIIGDITLEYMLTDDGKLRLKGFTRQNPNLLGFSAAAQGSTATGASVLYTTSFDHLFTQKRKKKAPKTSSNTK